MSPIAMRALPAAAVITIGAAVCGLSLSGSAAAAPTPRNAELVMHADRDRTSVPLASPPGPSSIKLEKSATPKTYHRAGQWIRYTYRVTNTERFLTLHDISVSDNRIHRPIHCLVTRLLPGRSTSCAAVYTITKHDIDVGHVTNVAVATGKTPTNGVVRSRPAKVTIHALKHTTLRIRKTASVHGYNAAGLPITYYYRVTNAGTVTLRHVRVTDSRGLRVSCPYWTLAPGHSITCTSHYVTTKADVIKRHIRNVGYVSGQPPHGKKVHASDPLVLRYKNRPGISIVKTAGVASFTHPGQWVTYYYLVTNNGNVPLHAVAVTDSRGVTVSCPRIWLGVAQAMTCTARYVTTRADVRARGIFNTGTVRGKTPHGVKVTDTASAFLRFTGSPFVPVTG